MSPEEQYRVLVVEDDPDVALLTRTIIERMTGAKVVVLNEASIVIAVIDTFHPDVIVTDIEMPAISGLALLDLVRDHRAGLPVVVMTAHASTAYAIRAIRGRADEFLTKPVSSADLAAVVVRLAEQWRSLRLSDHELERAAEVQRGLLPRKFVDLQGYRLAGGCAPARVVGGDFFDWYRVAGGVALTLADVMGKGIGAAIIAATVRAVLRSELTGGDLATGVAAAAARLESDLERAGSFATVFHAVVDAQTGVVRYVDAGHGLSLHVGSDGSVKRLATTSLPLGFPLEAGVHTGWREHSVILAPGDTLVSASDGVLDLYGDTLESLDEV
ncbi:MAG: SpoIIE family protein phosphatase, partial [Pseudolabrys sp.]|nr:SpoIIE family protein phosphatase [Pseudolabrys sp.]